MINDKALKHFERTITHGGQIAGSSAIVKSVSKKYPKLRVVGMAMASAAIFAMTTGNARALKIDELLVKQSASESGVDYRMFNSPDQSSFAVTNPEITDEYWDSKSWLSRKLLGLTMEYGMVGGDIAINQSQPLFTKSIADYLPAISNFAKHHQQPDLSHSLSRAGEVFSENYAQYTAVHEQQLAQDLKSRYSRPSFEDNAPHLADDFLLTTIALHHGADPEKFKSLFSLYVVEHEIGHSEVMYSVEGDADERGLLHEYAADYHGIMQALRQTAEQNPDEYAQLSASLMDGVRMLRTLTAADSDHIGAMLSTELLYDMHRQGAFSADDMLLLTRDSIVSRAQDLTRETDPVDLAALGKDSFVPGTQHFLLDRAASFAWIGEASDKTVIYMQDIDGPAYQQAKRSYTINSGSSSSSLGFAPKSPE